MSWRLRPIQYVRPATLPESSRLGEFALVKSGDDAYYLQNGIFHVDGK